MIIESGKYYKTRDGRKVGPTEAYDSTNSVYPMCHWVVDRVLYQSDGTFGDGTGPNKCDLIAEWEEGPVVTETVKRIVPGRYGCITVASEANGDRVQLVMASTSAELMTWYDAHELRAAAAVFTQLADALEESK